MLCVLSGQKAGGFGDQGGGYLNSPGFGSQQNASQDKKVFSFSVIITFKKLKFRKYPAIHTNYS